MIDECWESWSPVHSGNTGIRFEERNGLKQRVLDCPVCGKTVQLVPRPGTRRGQYIPRHKGKPRSK